MIHGLIWLPLLGLFFGLAWAGWNEAQKVNAYQEWAKEFQRSKYDLYAVIGQRGNSLTWGLPTRKGPINLETIALSGLTQVQVLVNDRSVDLEQPPRKGKTVLVLQSGDRAVNIPFTDPAIAVQWGKFLQKGEF